MKNSRFIAAFTLLMIVELVLAKFGQVGSYIYISLLPALILCLPTKMSTVQNMLVAFMCGLLTDFLADGVPGLNAAAIIPVAALQRTMISAFIDEELIERGYNFTFHKNGILKIGFVLLLMTLGYNFLYVILDCAGSRPTGFIASKILISTMLSFVFGLLVCNTLHPRQNY